MPAHSKKYTTEQRALEAQYDKTRNQLGARHRTAIAKGTLLQFHQNPKNHADQVEINRLAALLPGKNLKAIIKLPSQDPISIYI